MVAGELLRWQHFLGVNRWAKADIELDMRLGRQWILFVCQKLGAGGGHSRVYVFAPPGVFIWNGSVQDGEGDTPFQSVSLSIMFDDFRRGLICYLIEIGLNTKHVKVVAWSLILRYTPRYHTFYNALFCNCPKAYLFFDTL